MATRAEKQRISKEQALSFLLTYLVVEQGHTLTLDPLNLFNLNNLAQRATEEISASEGIIPHEIIEKLAAEYLGML